MNQLLIILVSMMSFWTDNSSKVNDVIDFYDKNPCIQKILQNSHTKEIAYIGMSIVAPEIAMNSEIRDFIEIQAMEMMYVEFNRSDFSIGPFQMKPSFASFIESYIQNNRLKQFNELKISAASDKEIRKIRIRRLTSVRWQALYLSAFLYYAELYTSNIKFVNDESKVKYWATLYNSKITSSYDEVQKLMKKQLFPHFAPKYNYADVAYEFYTILIKQDIQNGTKF